LISDLLAKIATKKNAGVQIGYFVASACRNVYRVTSREVGKIQLPVSGVARRKRGGEPSSDVGNVSRSVIVF
jgi:hypothetical protein